MSNVIAVEYREPHGVSVFAKVDELYRNRRGEQFVEVKLNSLDLKAIIENTK